MYRWQSSQVRSGPARSSAKMRAPEPLWPQITEKIVGGTLGQGILRQGAACRPTSASSSLLRCKQLLRSFSSFEKDPARDTQLTPLRPYSAQWLLSYARYVCIWWSARTSELHERPP